MCFFLPMGNDLVVPNFDQTILIPNEDEVVCPVYTLPLHEFRFQEYCNDQGIVCYLPLKRVWKVENHNRNGKSYQYSKEVLRPMFASYVFAKLTKEQKSNLHLSKSVLRTIPVPKADTLLRDITTIRKVELIGLGDKLEFNVGLKEGDHFLIESGPWQGVTGWLKKKEKHFQWTVEFEFMTELIGATIDPSKYKMTRIE